MELIRFGYGGFAPHRADVQPAAPLERVLRPKNLSPSERERELHRYAENGKQLRQNGHHDLCTPSCPWGLLPS